MRTLGVYVRVPFCATHCSYCDFVTYTADELRGRDPRAGYRGAGDRRAAAGGGRPRPGTAAGGDGLLRRWDADAAAARGLRRDPAHGLAERCETADAVLGEASLDWGAWGPGAHSDVACRRRLADLVVRSLAAA